MTTSKKTIADKFHADLKIKRHADLVMLALPKNGDYVQRDDFKVIGITLSERADAVNYLKGRGLVDGEKNRLALTSFGVDAVQNNVNRALPRSAYGKGTYTTQNTHNIRDGGLDHLDFASSGHRH